MEQLDETIVDPERRAGCKATGRGRVQMTVLASGRQTGGYELFRIAGPEGTGSGPHHHDCDESFFALDGALTAAWPTLIAQL